MSADTKWQKQGLCAPVSKDYDPWFSEEKDDQVVARFICMKCPVRAECLIHALFNDFEYGIFGGLSPEERKPLREYMLKTLDAKVLAKLSDSYLVVLPSEEYASPSVEAKYVRRHHRAVYCYEELNKLHPTEVPHYDMYDEVLHAVLKNPTGTGEELGRAIGKSTAMFNQRLRECFQYFDVDLSLL